MKKSLFLLTSLLIPMISYANTYFTLDSYSEVSVAFITQVCTISFMSNMFVKLGVVILNTSVSYLLIIILISLIIIFLLKALSVLDSLKGLQNTQKKLLEKKDEHPIL